MGEKCAQKRVEERWVSNWIVVDTDILIDAARGDERALQYLEREEAKTTLGVSVVTVMELLVGCKNKKEQQALEQFVKRFEVLPLAEHISTKAVMLLKKYRLSHGLLIADALIAATAIENGVPLASKNQRDYRFMDELALLPYPLAP